MADSEAGAPIPAGGESETTAPAALKPKRRRAPKKAASPKPETPAQPAPKPAPSPGPASLSEMVVAQTAASLADLSRNLTEAMTHANQVFSTAFMDQAQMLPTRSPDPFDVQGALNSVWGSLASHPETLRDAHAELWRRYADIWQKHAHYMLTGQHRDETASADKRFRDPEWRSNPAFSLLRETYLATSDFITDLVEKAEGVDEATKRKASFFIKQAVDAASPSNFLMTNPTALRELLRTQGESLKQGIDNLAADLKRGKGMLAIKQTDIDAFKIGENIAASPGEVVFRNDVFELIQYAPTTPHVHQVPLLIFPPWINKFYILDLQPKNSMIRWLVERGYTVFLVSWVNPDERLASKTFEDYMREGVYAAVQAVQDATGAEEINTVGYCIGGTLLASTLAHMAKIGDKRIKTATFFASQADFKVAGDLKIFTDDAGIKYLEDRMDQHGGLLDAQAMADTFNSLRANDLIWNYVVDNYYLGKGPLPFDLLYWNADQTRMPKTLHLFYLRTFYRDNALTEGKLDLLGEQVSLGDVTIPVFLQSSKEDHIAPCASVMRTASFFGGPVDFIAAGSGHIAGVINHPNAGKYQYWTNPSCNRSVDDWFNGATEHKGSWWPHWDQWLARHAGEDIPARVPGEGKLKPICPAPGEYVRVRSED
jgi:polyhydroxyalkanoate synthase